MRAVLQRVSYGRVTVEGKTVGEIGEGLLIFLGIGQDDNETIVKSMVDKIVKLRIFPDSQGKMNLSLLDIRGEVLVISQFTLLADIKRGLRPSFINAAAAPVAISLYEFFIKMCSNYSLKVESGVFGALMRVELTNEGPVTILVDSEEL